MKTLIVVAFQDAFTWDVYSWSNGAWIYVQSEHKTIKFVDRDRPELLQKALAQTLSRCYNRYNSVEPAIRFDF